MSDSTACEGPDGDTVPPRVLVVEDDPTLAEVVHRYLERDGYRIEVANTGESGLEAALEWQPDLVVLDIMLPGIDGYEVCRQLRNSTPIPVIMLTARASEDDRVLGLELGADDYLTKPFSPRELAARVSAVLRRCSGSSGLGSSVGDPKRGAITVGDIELDLGSREVVRDASPVHLTAKEFDLLAHLMRNPRTAFSRTELMAAVWGWTYGDTATVTVHIRRLRTKVEQDPANPVHLVTVSGGYRFDP